MVETLKHQCEYRQVFINDNEESVTYRCNRESQWVYTDNTAKRWFYCTQHVNRFKERIPRAERK
jgi:hypothetical protein